MSSARLASFRRLLAAALGTQYYRPWLEAAGLHTPQLIQALDSIEPALERFPPLKPEAFLMHREQFHNPAAPPPPPAQLFYPYRTMPRTAVLAEQFRSRRRLRVFPNGLGRRLVWFRPEAIAGPLAKLCKLAELVESGALKLRPLRDAVIVLTRIDQPPLSDADRERLWRCFQVPIYQQLLGFSGELLAWECEAHEGLHIVTDDALFETQPIQGEPRVLATSLVDLVHPLIRVMTGCRGRVGNGLCGCGQTGERLLLLSDEGCFTAVSDEALQAEQPTEAVLS